MGKRRNKAARVRPVDVTSESSRWYVGVLGVGICFMLFCAALSAEDVLAGPHLDLGAGLLVLSFSAFVGMFAYNLLRFKHVRIQGRELSISYGFSRKRPPADARRYGKIVWAEAADNGYGQTFTVMTAGGKLDLHSVCYRNTHQLWRAIQLAARSPKAAELHDSNSGARHYLAAFFALGALGSFWLFQHGESKSTELILDDALAVRGTLVAPPSVRRGSDNSYLLFGLTEYADFEFRIVQDHYRALDREAVLALVAGDSLTVWADADDVQQKLLRTVPLSFGNQHFGYARILPQQLVANGQALIDEADYVRRQRHDRGWRWFFLAFGLVMLGMAVWVWRLKPNR